MKYRYLHRRQAHTVDLLAATKHSSETQVNVDAQQYNLRSVRTEAGLVSFELDGKQLSATVAREGRHLWVHFDGKNYALERVVGSEIDTGAAGGERVLRAPMPGQVRDVLVSPGQSVAAGETLILLEAMKMEIRIQAPQAGSVARLAVIQGQNVDRDQILVELDSESV